MWGKNWEADRSLPECCTPDTFRICLTGFPRSTWNKSAARVFARSFLEYYNIQETPEELDDLYERALTRFRGMKLKKQALDLDQAQKDDRAQRDRRRSRKAGVRGIYLAF